PSGVVSTIATNTSTTDLVNDLAFDSNGNLFVTFDNSVVEFLGGLGPVPITIAAVPGGAGGIAIEPPATTNLSTRVSVQAGDGVGLIERNDLSTSAGSKLTNVSTRGFVGTGENVMIGGLILSGGGGERQILVRALGPTLAQPPLNIAGSLMDPMLMLVDAI